MAAPAVMPVTTLRPRYSSRRCSIDRMWPWRGSRSILAGGADPRGQGVVSATGRRPSGMEGNGRGVGIPRRAGWSGRARASASFAAARLARLAAAKTVLTARHDELVRAETDARVEVIAATARLDAARRRWRGGRGARLAKATACIRDPGYEAGLADVTMLLRAAEAVAQAETQSAPPTRRSSRRALCSSRPWKGCRRDRSDECVHPYDRHDGHRDERRAGCRGSHAESPAVDARPAIAVAVARVGMAALGDTFEAGGLVKRTRPQCCRPASSRWSARSVSTRRSRQRRPGARRARRNRPGRALARRDRRGGRRRRGGPRRHHRQREADAALALASIGHTRVEELHGKRSATQQELDNADADLTMAEARAQGAVARSAVARSAVESAEAARDAAATTAGLPPSWRRSMVWSRPRRSKWATWRRPVNPSCGLRTFAACAWRPGSTNRASTPPSRHSRASGTRWRRERRRDRRRGQCLRRDARRRASAHVFLVKIALPAGTLVEPGRFGRARFTTGTRSALILS